MTFAWPRCCSCCCSFRSGCCVWPSTGAATRARGVRRVGPARRDGSGAAAGDARPATDAPVARRARPLRRIPGALLVRRPDRDARRPRPAPGRGQRPAPGGHGRPRVRRLGQHGRHGPARRPGWRPPRPRPRTFVERQPPSVVIGVVAFSDSGLAVQQPTQRPGRGPRRHRPARGRSGAPRSGRASSPR